MRTTKPFGTLSLLRTVMTLLIGSAALYTNATVRTVSNLTNHPAQYTSLQTAINAAVAGDTILVTASTTSYGFITLNKRVTLIGGGHNIGGPSSQVNEVRFYNGSSNSTIIGFLCAAIFIGESTAVSGVRIERCRVTGNISRFNDFASNGLIIRNCVVQGNISLASLSNNVLITNNLIRGTLSVQTANATNMVVSHNLFTSTATGPALGNLNAAVISDNIFWKRTPVAATLNNCVFNNNITFQCTDNTIPYGTNVGSNNLIGVDPQFVNAPASDGAITYDYNLQAASPGHNAGSDGTDIGFFGGAYPFIDLSGRPRIPLVTNLTVLNTSIGQGGSLNVEFSGTTVE